MSVIALGWLSAGLRLVLWAVTCFGIITLLDRFNEDPFGKDKARLNRSPVAIALYRGLRWAAVFIGSAIILS